MRLLGAAQGIGKADGHYSDWRAANAYDIIFIRQEKHLPRISQEENGGKDQLQPGCG